MQADDGEEASSPSSPTAVSGARRCWACPVLIQKDWPLCFQHCWSGWPATEGAASTCGKRNELAHMWSKITFYSLNITHVNIRIHFISNSLLIPSRGILQSYSGYYHLHFKIIVVYQNYISFHNCYPYTILQIWWMRPSQKLNLHCRHTHTVLSSTSFVQL